MLSGRRAIEDLVDFAVKSRTRVLFVQVYRANKAWFASSVADSEPYRGCLRSVGEDPMALLIRKAHAAGIEVHAWFNLLSLSTNEDAPILKKYGSAVLTRNSAPKKSVADYKIDNQYFLEPGDVRVQKTLERVVTEAVRAYPGLDGVQFDYIRYPDVHPAYGHTKANVSLFKKETGERRVAEDNPAWKRWKYGRVTALVRRLRHAARAIHPGLQVSTTGLMPYSRASLESHQDWKFWLDSGLVDFVTLMCYTRDMEAFEKYLKDAQKRTGRLQRVNIAVGAYKLHDDPAMFERQFAACEEAAPRGCVVLDYGDLVENPALAGSFLDPHTSSVKK